MGGIQGIGLDIATMLGASDEFNQCAEAVQNQVSELAATVDDFPFGREIVSEVWAGLYSFAAGYFQEALGSHVKLLEKARDDIMTWKNAIVKADSDAADGFRKGRDIINNLTGDSADS